MKVGEIVTRVKAAIDELRQNGTALLSESEDEQNLSQIIVDKIGYALQYVIENAPLEKLDSSLFESPTSEELATFSIADDLKGTVTLPTDVLRIIEARLSSWSHFPVPEAATSQIYQMQQDKYARGSWDRPVNILTFEGGEKKLEMYCAKTAEDKLILTFIRQPKLDIPADDDHEVPVPSQLDAALVYQVAGLTMIAFREELATSLFAIAKRYLDPDGVKSEE